jgi:hypothetical protein
MNRFQPPIEDLSTHSFVWRKRPIVQTTIDFVNEHNYERLHIDDGILDTEGQHPNKRIVTKHLGWNIIATLHGIDISKAEEGHNDDDDDNDTNIFDEAIKAPNDNDYHEPRPNIQILPLVILLWHKSQGLHNHRHLAFCNSYTYVNGFFYFR